MAHESHKMPDKPPTLHYLTFVPGRYSGKYKVHTGLNHAKNALSIRSNYGGAKGGVIWQWNEAENVWVEIFRVEPTATELPWR